MPEVIKTIFVGDSSQITGEYRKLSAELQSYVRENQVSFKNSASGHATEIRALKLEADGFRNLATSMREQAAMKEQAISLAQRSNISIQAALSLLQEEYQLRKNIATAAQAQAAASGAAAARAVAIANPRATGLPGGGGLAPLTPQSLQAMDRATASTRELRRQTILAGQAGKNGSLGFLAFSQAIEDAQYGIKGVLNNIPQMILGFGGTAGLAGAISLAAVAATILYPRLKALYGATDNEAVKKAAAEWDKVFREGLKASKEFEKAASVERQILLLSAQINESYRARLGVLTQMGGYYDSELTAARQIRDTEGQILAARLKLAEASGTGVPAAQAAVDTAATAGLEADLVNRKKEYIRVQDELLSKVNATENIAAEAAARELSDTARLVQLKRDLAGADANVASLAPTQVDGKEVLGDLNTRISRRNATERQQAIKAEIDLLEKSSAARKEAAAAAIAAANAEISRLDAKTNLTKQETEELQRQIAVRKELLQIQSDTRQTEAILRNQVQMEKEAADAAEERLKFQNDAIAKWRSQMDSEAGTGGARADYQAEIVALQLQANGRADLAKSMREETALRKEAAEIASEQGLTEEQALELARQRAGLLKEITAQEEKAALRAQKHPQWKPRSEYQGIRRAQNGAADFNSGNNLRDWSPDWNMGGPTRSNGRPIKSAAGGLKQEALRKRQQERENAALRNSSDPNVRIGQKSLEIQEQLLEGLKKIGVIK